MNNTLDKIKCYSFNKQDFIVLLSLYNVIYLVSSSIVKGHLIICFVAAFLTSLIVMLVIAWTGFLKKKNEEQISLEQEQEFVRKKIRDEYLKVHKMKRKNELLIKADCLLAEQLKKNIIVDRDGPQISANKNFKEIKKEVHFNYIDDTTFARKASEPVPQSGRESNPKGHTVRQTVDVAKPDYGEY